ncbi:copper amine oxidase N-terminal domain-containing protein [Tyzzerella sp. OttesenSCG-928-J15]|nr:copper amine oxidase N-terminal domain-containing protein [Tyzzerella sp. OttesenSCG-928-J15]
MKKFLKPLALTLAAIFTITCVPTVQNVMAAPVNANIVINNRPYLPQNTIENINDRMLLPFREISEAIGATVDWDGNTRRILTTYGERYSIMYINNPTVTYGYYSIDSSGTMQFEKNPSTMLMDVYPQLVGNLTYIPLRAFAETLGAEVNWVSQTSTAYINVDEANAPVEETPSPTPTPVAKPDNYDDFSNTSHFKDQYSETIKNMYEDSKNRPFVFVLYNKDEESSKMLVPTIQDVAQSIGYRIYGLDMSDKANKAKDNEWLWSFFRENAFESPTMYFVYSKDKVEQMQKPDNEKSIEEALIKFAALAETSYAYGDFGDTEYFKSKSDTFIESEYLDYREFILVLYDKTDEDSKQYIPIIKAAAKERQQTIYAIDIDRYPKFNKNVTFLKDYDANGDFPQMILVYRDKDDNQTYKQPQTVERTKNYIDEFNKNKGTSSSTAKYDDFTGDRYYRNADILDLRTRRNNYEEFVIFMYDSSDRTYKDVVEDFIYYADRASSTRNVKVYGINKSSTVFSNNLEESNYDWLSIGSEFYKTEPMIISVKQNGIPFYKSLKSTQDLIDEFEPLISY